jgi:hypothetical protein
MESGQSNEPRIVLMNLLTTTLDNPGHERIEKSGERD